MSRLLVIENRPPTDEASHEVATALASFDCDYVAWRDFSPLLLARATPRLVVAVAVPPTDEARGFIAWLRDNPVPPPTLAVLPAEELITMAATGIVDDFVLWPSNEVELQQRVIRMLGAVPTDAEAVGEQLDRELALAKLVGRDPAFLAAVGRIPAIARSDRPVVITGETGTGKELCARAIHHLSRRRSFPFVPLDCSTCPDHLFENEVFGHVRGAFTDAHSDQKGLVAMADRGTLFLDEVDALSLPAQAKLLRFLQERSFRPLGADRFARADVNVLAATNCNLEQLVREQRFRADLYFRLNVLRLHLVPLRARRGDMALLSQHFLQIIAAEAGLPRKLLARSALQRLLAYDWPGNLRELYNVLQRAFVFADGQQILASHILIEGTPPAGIETRTTFGEARRTAIAGFERRYLEDLLRRHGGNVTHAAREAGKDRRALGRLLKKHDIDRLKL